MRNIFARLMEKSTHQTPADEEKALDEILMTQDRTRITQSVLKMGRMTYKMLEQSLYVAETNNDKDAQAVIDQDNDVDRLEMEIDWECLSTMAMRQPIHKDLRFLFAVIKLTTDLERVADESTNIARHLMLHRSVIQETEDLTVICSLRDFLLEQLEDVMKAFEEQNLSLAEKVFTGDRFVDTCYNKLYESFLDTISEKASIAIRRQAYILTLARHLERAGDHIANIAEYIGFMITGERIASEADPNKDALPHES